MSAPESPSAPDVETGLDDASFDATPAPAAAEPFPHEPRRPLAQEVGLNIARGALMGAADVIPGVSGGTMALIVGIYVRLLAAVRTVTGVPLALLRGDVRGAVRDLRSVEWALVLPLLIGIVGTIALAAGVIVELRESWPSRTNGFFFGLIAASVAVPWRMIAQPRREEVALVVASTIGAFLLVGLPPREIADPSLVLVFFAAAIAICAMILPGISGSFLLLVMGMYTVTLAQLDAGNLVYIAVFVLGAAIGIGAFSRVLSWLLEHQHDRTMAVLVGLMLGSLRALWPWQDDDRSLLAPPADSGEVLAVALLALLGFGAVTLLVHVAARHEHRHAGTR